MHRNQAILAAVLLATGMLAAPVHARSSLSGTSSTIPSIASPTNPGVLKLVRAGLPADTAKAPAVKAPERPGEADPGSAHKVRDLWIAKFTGQTKALAAIAAVQQGDLATLQQSNLFGKVSSFTAEAKQPAGTWALSAKETSFSKGSAAKRVMLGFGSGRAHIVMEYKLRNPKGKVVWSKKIKTEPPFWGSGGMLGGAQNQNRAFSKQPQKLLEALSQFFGSK